MKLHELSPAEGSVKPAWRKAEDPVPETEKRPEKVTRDRTLAAAAEYVPDLKAVRSRFTESCRREASTTDLRRNMPL